MLALRSVHAGMGGFLILRDVTFELEAGKTTVLVGRNGAGKTTTSAPSWGSCHWTAEASCSTASTSWRHRRLIALRWALAMRPKTGG
jgi:ABC-type Mn2+/Zn2+ transport system ATPase subunit